MYINLSTRLVSYFDQNKNSDLIIFDACDVLIDHDVNLTVQFVEHNVDVVKNSVGIIGIVKVCVTLGGRR